MRIKIPQQASEQDQVEERFPPPSLTSTEVQDKRPREQDDEKKVIDSEALSEAVEKVKEALQTFDKNVMVSLDTGTGVMVAKVFNGETGEMIRQVPPQQILDVASRIHEAVGLLFDDEA